MARLTATEFNTPDFFGYGTSGRIPGGYGPYQHIRGVGLEDDWYKKAQTFVSRGGLVGLKVLELGCGFGSLVRHMRSLGANAYGLDLSWPISKGLEIWPELAPYLIIAEAKAWLLSANRTRNEYEAVISRGFLECFSDADLAVMIPRINYICKSQQIHSIDPNSDPNYYNTKSVAAWEALDFEAGTIIMDEAN